MEIQYLEPRRKSLDLGQDSSRTQSRDAEIPRKSDSHDKEPLDTKDSQEISTSLRRRNEKFLGRLQFLALCWTLFLIGWNDSSTGPLIPRIREFYGVTN